MENVRVVYMLDGKTRVLVPAPKCKLSLEEIIAKDVPPGAENVQVVDASFVPSDRRLRNAWELKPGRIDINRPKAEEVVRDRLRAQREPKMAELDIEQLKNLGKPDALAAAEAKKQALRDVPAKDFSKLSIEQLAALDLDGALKL